MYLIIDEDCPACLVRYADGFGHTAQRSIHITGLGTGAEDSAIWHYAQVAGGVIVTRNFIDYVPFARGRRYAGLLVLPSMEALGTARLFQSLMTWIADAPFQGNIADHFVEIKPGGGIRSFQV